MRESKKMQWIEIYTHRMDNFKDGRWSSAIDQAMQSPTAVSLTKIQFLHPLVIEYVV